MAGPDLLRELAGRTGGRAFEVGNLAELPDVASKIAIELRNEYVLGYSPKNSDARRKISSRGGEDGKPSKGCRSLRRPIAPATTLPPE